MALNQPTSNPEELYSEFFAIKDVPDSWLKLPLTKKDAVKENLKWFFTQKPCIYGHYSLRRASSPSCVACEKIREKDPKSKSKYARYREKNREKINSRTRARRADPDDHFRESRLQSSRKYRTENLGSIRLSNAASKRSAYAENPEKFREYARIFQKSTERKIKRNERRNFRRKTNILFIIKERARTRLYLVLKNQNIPKTGNTKDLLGVENYDELKNHLELQFADGMNWDNLGEWHIDHIRPCASFDLSVEKQVQLAFNWRNLQPIWSSENLEKRDSYDSSAELSWIKLMHRLDFKGDLFLIYE